MFHDILCMIYSIRNLNKRFIHINIQNHTSWTLRARCFELNIYNGMYELQSLRCKSIVFRLSVFCWMCRERLTVNRGVHTSRSKPEISSQPFDENKARKFLSSAFESSTKLAYSEGAWERKTKKPTPIKTTSIPTHLDI